MKDHSQAFERFLKFWRGVHGVSQEELAFRLNSSTRHLSRLENGACRPSESIVLEIGKVLNLGKRDLNHLLISAGFTQVEERLDFASPELAWLRKSTIKVLQALDPYPASVIDSYSNILMVNKGFVSFFSQFLASTDLAKIENNYDFIFSRGSDVILNWEDTLSAILMSIQQVTLFSNSEADQLLLARLCAHPNVPKDWKQRAALVEPKASIEMEFELEGQSHRFLNVSTTIGSMGAAAFVSEPRLALNILCPVSDELKLDGLLQADAKHPLLFY